MKKEKRISATFRLTEEMLKRLKEEAEKQNRSYTNMLETILREYFNK